MEPSSLFLISAFGVGTRSNRLSLEADSSSWTRRFWRACVIAWPCLLRHVFEIAQRPFRRRQEGSRAVMRVSGVAGRRCESARPPERYWPISTFRALDDLERDEEAESAAMPDRLGGEKGIEYALQDFWRNAGAAVGQWQFRFACAPARQRRCGRGTSSPFSPTLTGRAAR